MVNFKPLKASGRWSSIGRSKYHFQLPILYFSILKLTLRSSVQHYIEEIGLQDIIQF
jgi:hypothetical protein